MATKSQMTLTVCVNTSLGATIELVAQATRGSVSKAKVSAQAATYDFTEIHETGAFVITFKNSRQRSAEHLRNEVLHVLCALHFLGGTSLEGFGFSKNVQLAEVDLWLSAQKIEPLSLLEPIHTQTNLTLCDLQGIWQSLTHAEEPVDVLLRDKEFSEMFPYADLVAGVYEALRHRSGCEVYLQTREDGTITAHRVDCPNPVSTLVSRWQQQQNSASKAGTYTSDNRDHGIFHSEGYRGTNENRWRISKMLGTVPSHLKPNVFAWAADAIHSVEEFHNTHGGVALPETFECQSDGVFLTADRDLRIRRRE